MSRRILSSTFPAKPTTFRRASKQSRAKRCSELNPNSEVEVECGAAARGAHAAGVRFSAARRKSRPTNFLAPKSDKEGETKVWASRPNRHAGRVRYPFLFRSSGLMRMLQVQTPESLQTFNELFPPRSASRRMRILSSVVYRLPFIVWSFL